MIAFRRLCRSLRARTRAHAHSTDRFDRFRAITDAWKRDATGSRTSSLPLSTAPRVKKKKKKKKEKERNYLVCDCVSLKRRSSRARERTKARPAPEEEKGGGGWGGRRAACTAFAHRTAFHTSFSETRSTERPLPPGSLPPGPPPPRGSRVPHNLPPRLARGTVRRARRFPLFAGLLDQYIDINIKEHTRAHASGEYRRGGGGAMGGVAFFSSFSSNSL